MREIPLIASQRRLDRFAHNRMQETRRRVLREHLEPHEPGGQPQGRLHVHIRHRRRVPQLAAVPQHGERLRKPKRARIQPPNPRRHLPREALSPARQKLIQIKSHQWIAVKLRRPEQLAHVERIAAARARNGGA